MVLYNYFITEKPFRVFYRKVDFVFESNMNEMITQEQRLAQSLRSRGDYEIPTGSGICIYGGFNRPVQLVTDYTQIRCSGDETVAAASGEAPYIRGINGGYFIHGKAPAYKKLYDEYISLKTKIKKDALIPSFEDSKYSHSSALGDDLLFYSNLHAITKIVVNVVDKEWV